MAYGCISYSLFGHGLERYKDCYPQRDYLRGLEFNIRTALLVYPEYKVVVNLDEQTYDAYKKYFDEHKDRGYLEYYIHPRRELCAMMLYRLYPIWTKNWDRVLCRDADSLVSVREAKCVRYWERTGRVAHSIADSISHTEILMGGMIGFGSREFRERTNCENFQQFMSLGSGIDFNKKGSDQDFLNKRILQYVAPTITEHHMLGIPNTFRNDWSNKVPDEDMGFPPEWDELNHICMHIGAAGMREPALLLFLNQHGKDNEHFNRIEKMYPKIFYWHL